MSWRDTPCKLWTGAKNKRGYGWRRVGGKTRKVHRLAWIEAYGEPPPETPYVLHYCDTPACYELEHLWLGTNDDNMRDMVAKGRHWNQLKTHCKNGHEFNPENTKLLPSGRRCCLACRWRPAHSW